jgi:hypothetical protein
VRVPQRWHRGWRSADPPNSPLLFINPRSGGGKAARAGLAEHARTLGSTAVELEPGQDLAALVQEAIANGADALGMAGGDGSGAVVAAAACVHGLPFVCVPAGTRNHFALDGVARHHLIGSLAAFTDGIERRVDVGEVDGRVFINNVSLRIDGDAVQRPGYRGAKVRTLLETRLRLDTGCLGVMVLDGPNERRQDASRAWSASSLEVRAPGRFMQGSTARRRVIHRCTL